MSPIKLILYLVLNLKFLMNYKIMKLLSEANIIIKEKNSPTKHFSYKIIIMEEKYYSKNIFEIKKVLL